MSERPEILAANVIGLDLKYGRMDLTSGHTVSCWLIAEHTGDRDYIGRRALELRMTGCRTFHVCGRHASLWRAVLWETGMLFGSGSKPDPVGAYHDLNSFADTLRAAMDKQTPVPEDIFLLYDDPDIYREVVRRLGLYR